MQVTPNLHCGSFFASNLKVIQMKIKILFFTLLLCGISIAQNKGTIKGTLIDKDANNTPLAFANAIIKGTTVGTTTDEKGQYSPEFTGN